MSKPAPDNRIKFEETIALRGPVAIVVAEVFGGPIIRMQVGVYDADDKFLTGVGTNGVGEPVTSENGGVASWLFDVPPNASYIKWGVQAGVSAAGIRRYSVNGKVRDENGETLVAGRFGAEIPSGAAFDDVIFDGVNVAVQSSVDSIPVGPKA
jgi:hypothetical protein